MRAIILVGLFVGLCGALPHHTGPAIANQESNIAGGSGITGISHGTATAQGGPGGAISNQKSTAIGGNDATLVADGSSSATSQGGPDVSQYLNKYGLGGGGRHPGGKHPGKLGGGGGGLIGGGGGGKGGLGGGGGPAISNQESQIRGGDGVTGIASGQSAAEGGRGGAISNQKSSAIAGDDSTLVASGSSQANTRRHRRDLGTGVYTDPGGVLVVAQRDIPDPARSARRLHRGGNAVAIQNSQADAGNFGSAKAKGQAQANSSGGSAKAVQNSRANAGNGGRADASGSAIANAKRSILSKRDVAADTSKTISDVIEGKTKNVAEKIAENDQALIVSGKVVAKTT